MTRDLLAEPGAGTQSTDTGSRGLGVATAVLILIFIVLSWLLRAPAMLTRQDDARYLVLARALRGGTYRDLMWPGAPWHHMYPPGYPALLAAWIAIGGERFDWLIVLQILVSAVSIGVMYLAVRRAAPPLVAMLAVAVLAVSPGYIFRAGQVASEGALAVCFSIGVWAAVTIPPGRKQVAVLILVSMLAPLMRTVGVALPAAVAVCWLLERRYKDVALLAAVGVVIVGATIAWTLSDPSPVAGNSYVGDMTTVHHGSSGMLATMPRRVLFNAYEYLTTSLPVLLAMPTIEGTVIDNAIGATIVTVALLVGLARSATRFRLGALVVIAYAGILALWPYQQTRFLVPLLPLLVPIILLGLLEAGGRIRANLGRYAMIGAASVFVVTGLVTDVSNLRATSACQRGQPIPPAACISPDQASFFSAAIFIRDSLPRDARVFSAKSEPLYVYTGRLTLPAVLWLRPDTTAFWNGLRQNKVDYILLGALHFAETRRLAVLLSAHCDALDLVAAFPPRTYLFRTTASRSVNHLACDSVEAYQRVAPRF